MSFRITLSEKMPAAAAAFTISTLEACRVDALEWPLTFDEVNFEFAFFAVVISRALAQRVAIKVAGRSFVKCVRQFFLTSGLAIKSMFKTYFDCHISKGCEWMGVVNFIIIRVPIIMALIMPESGSE